MLNHGSLFSGIGGFDLAAQRTGWNNVFHCEWNPFGRKVLNYYWPNSESYEDITKADFKKYRGQLDVLTGGFPCQPFSLAGSRAGSEDDRYLWPEMLRAIKEIRPTWVVGENVTGIVTMVQPGEITSMESQANLFEEDYSVLEYEQDFVIETICSDLESIGYTVQPIIIPACAVGAPHRRDRIWFIAFNTNSSTGEQTSDMEGKNRRGSSESIEKELFQKTHNKHNRFSKISSCDKIITNTERIGQSKQGESERQVYSEQNREGKASWANNDGGWPIEHPICDGNDGISSRLDGITFSKWREESIKAGGNAIVPQIAEEIFKFIDECDNFN